MENENEFSQGSQDGQNVTPDYSNGAQYNQPQQPVQDANGFSQAYTTQDTQAQYAQAQAQSVATEQSSGFAIAGMVCGILSIVCCCLGWVSLILAIVGMVFSVLTLVQKKPGKGMAIAGIVCSAIGLVITILVFVFAFYANNTYSGTRNYRDIIRMLESME